MEWCGWWCGWGRDAAGGRRPPARRVAPRTRRRSLRALCAHTSLNYHSTMPLTRRCPSLDDAPSQRQNHRLRAVIHAEFLQDAVDVSLHGAFRDAQELGDLRVAAAQGHLL